MISWVVIVILVIIGIFAIRMNHLRHRFFIIILVLIAILLYVGVYVINSQNNLDLSTFEGFVNALGVYKGWMANSFQNLKVISANAIKLDWTSTNASFFENSKPTSKTKTTTKKTK